jgi:EAL domain-containing protein (putative c-di-GMP-specific phosphodiesterase class I)/CheY-like chemotaxis protein
MMPKLDTLRVIVIDDEPFVLKVLVRQLANLGCTQVLAFERAQDALAVLESGPTDDTIVFCDLQMPEMDGVEVVRHLGRIGFAGRLALVSGEDGRILSTTQRLAVAHDLHVAAALHKPVTPEHLREALRHAVPVAVPAQKSTMPRYTARDLALAIQSGQLTVFYQPKVKLATGAVDGVEALVRWNHPDDGLVYPDQFIGLAEEAGLIDDLTLAVIVQALSDARSLHQQGWPLAVAVNVSMDNLVALDFPDLVAKAANATGVPLSSLVLEITESRLMRDPLAALDILTRLRLKRIGLSIDDFGTGHSSLSQLQDIPFDELKVDRRFVHRAHSDASVRAILDGSLSMARQLHLRTVAEGVEDERDWSFLRSSGCDLAQGYFVCRPVPLANLIAWHPQWLQRFQAMGEAGGAASA